MASSQGFLVNLSGWTLSNEHRLKLDAWAAKYFVDFAWHQQSLLGWLDEPSTVPRMRELVHHNLKYWRCAKAKRYQRQWVGAISAADFYTFAGRPPKPFQCMVKSLLAGVYDTAVHKADDILTRRERLENEAAEHDRSLCKAVLKALRSNASKLDARLRDARMKKALLLKSHLAVLAKLRDENPDLVIRLPADWETVPPDQACEQLQRGAKRKRDCFLTHSKRWRQYAEEDEAKLLRDIESG